MNVPPVARPWAGAVAWAAELEALYQEFNPGRCPDVDAILTEFAGYEETLWLSLVKHHGVPDRRPVHRLGPGAPPAPTTRQRVIRFYARYCPDKLEQLDTVLAYAAVEGTDHVMGLLAGKYGPEPPVVSESVRERLLVLLATHRRMDRAPEVLLQLERYGQMAHALLRSTVAEVGPEPHLRAGDDLTPELRLQLYLDTYAPAHPGRYEGLLQRYVATGDDVRLFATLQRELGREPTGADARAAVQSRAAAAAQAEDEAKQRKEAERLAARQRRLAELGDHDTTLERVGAKAWDTPDLTELRPLPSGWKRPNALGMLRDLVQHGTSADGEFRDVLQRIFVAYDRPLIGHIPRLEEAHMLTGEGNEFLACVEMCYTNAVPRHTRPTLRQQASLLDMKLGAKVDEFTAAGGVNAFLAGVDASAEDDWSLFLAVRHGVATEAELASRHRVYAYYGHYNEGCSLAAAEKVLDSFGGDVSAMHRALASHYGPEPPAPDVDEARVRGILERNAPERLSSLEVVIDAHSMLGDSSDAVLRRVVRTYGPEPSDADGATAALLVAELEARFGVFVQELRLRLSLYRRRRMMEYPELDVLSTIIQGAPAFWADAARQGGERALPPTTAPAEVLQAAEEERIAVAASSVERDEMKARQEVRRREEVAVKQLLTLYGDTLDVWDHDSNVVLAESIARHFLHDAAVAAYPALQREMKDAEAELMVWLEGRLMWRALWKEEEAARAKAAAMTEQRLATAKHEEVARVAPRTAASSEHQAHMQQAMAALHEQSTKVLRYNAAVMHARRTKPLALSASIAPTRPLHKNCRLHGPEFQQAAPQPHVDPTPPDAPRDPDVVFLEQCHEYIRHLVRTFDPLRLPSLDADLRRFQGREAELAAALEQQYDARPDPAAAAGLTRRVTEFYQRVAPERIAEADVVLHRFQGRPDALWGYLRARYGAEPPLRSDAVRQYLVRRLERYLGSHAPQLAPRAGDLVDRCPDPSGGALFAELTAAYGPEAEDEEIADIAARLRAFYKARRLLVAAPTVEGMARRFAGKLDALNAGLMQRFGATLADVDLEHAV